MEYKEEFECSSLKEIFDVVRSIKERDYRFTDYYFRGQRKFEWGLISNLKRESFETYNSASIEKKAEIIGLEIQKEIDIYNDFKNQYGDDVKLIDYANHKIEDENLKLQIIDPPKKFETIDNVSMIALMQHYGKKTRALDFSENLLTALFFAVNKKEGEEDTDAALWILNKNMMNMILINQKASDFIDYLPRADVDIIPREKYLEYLQRNLEAYKNIDEDIKEICKDKDENEILGLYQVIIDQMRKPFLGLEEHSVFVGDLESGLFNKRQLKQSGVFILQGYKPTDIKEEYDKLIDNIKKVHFDTKGKVFDSQKIYSPFVKIRIKKECLEEIREFLNLVGINKRSLGL